MGTMSVSNRTLCLTLEVVNGDNFYLVFGQKETGAKRVTMATTLRV